MDHKVFGLKDDDQEVKKRRSSEKGLRVLEHHEWHTLERCGWRAGGGHGTRISAMWDNVGRKNTSLFLFYTAHTFTTIINIITTTSGSSRSLKKPIPDSVSTARWTYVNEHGLINMVDHRRRLVACHGRKWQVQDDHNDRVDLEGEGHEEDGLWTSIGWLGIA